ncbi:hypothetical protein MHF_0357 [Mycoplasma haemofelis Ohio2]|uniref:Lipoprotein n=1 Tax=Mycoplasma haemofelis (strain Ohio2) TaxID=859194 RepID=F6FH31_MYCHI|nr:hypothetical protein MHF_0357 [Mycoplasma haemofelis Ohio2]
MTNLAKLTFCGGAVGSCSAAAAGYHFLNKSTHQETPKSKKTVGDSLRDEKFVLLSYTDGNSSEWSKVLEKYKSSGEESKFSGVNLSAESAKDNDNIAQLKEKCKSIVEGEFEQGIHDKAKKWCVVPQNLRERMTALSVTALDYSNEKDKNTSTDSWKEKIKTYKGDEGLSSSSTWSSASGEDDKVEAIKKDCKSFLEGETRSYDSDFEEKYKKAIAWCA